MKKLLLLAAVPLTALGLLAQVVEVGNRVPALPATSLQGGTIQINPESGTLTVLVFTSTRCPVSNAYNDRMEALYQQYSVKGVNFMALNANANEPASEISAHMKSHGLTFPIFKDEQNVVADRLNARVTPEAFVLDRAGTLLYHGAVDDAQNPARVTVKALQAAIDAGLAGKPVANTGIKALGCTIKRARKSGSSL